MKLAAAARGRALPRDMDEVGMGAGAPAFRAADEARMHRGHDLWLAALKWIAEGG
jgi:hypothetical protein